MDHKNLLKRRFDFYKEIKKKVEVYLGRQSLAIRQYKKNYDLELGQIKSIKLKKKYEE